MDDDDDDVPDMDEFAAQGSADAADTAALPAAGAGGAGGAGPGYKVATEPVDSFLKTRTYDVSITYDKYYQVGPSRGPAALRPLRPRLLLRALCIASSPAR